MSSRRWLKFILFWKKKIAKVIDILWRTLMESQPRTIRTIFLSSNLVSSLGLIFSNVCFSVVCHFPLIYRDGNNVLLMTRYFSWSSVDETTRFVCNQPQATLYCSHLFPTIWISFTWLIEGHTRNICAKSFYENEPSKLADSEHSW